MAAHLGLLLTFDFSTHPGLFYLFVALAWVGLFWAQRLLRRQAFQMAPIILLVAAALRILLVPLPLSLSDDLMRYEWDGRVLNSGMNPYGLAPEAKELEFLRDDLWRALPHREVPTVYPPLALAAFSIAARFSSPGIFLKLLLVAADLLTCALLLTMCRWRGWSEKRVLWYAWNPLVTLEVAAMGHIDALGVMWVVLTVVLLSRHKRPLLAGVVAAAGVATKLLPLISFPAWWKFAAKPRLFLLAAGGLTACMSTVWLATVGGIPPGLTRYGVSWEFNGAFHEPLWRLLESLQVPDLLKAGLDSMKGVTHEHHLWNSVYPLVYPQLISKALLTLVLFGAILFSLRAPTVEDGTRRVFAGALLASATFYPWYLLWVLPWAALASSRPWIALSATMTLAYVPRLFDIAYWPWVYVVIWVPFFLLMVREKWSTA